MKKSFLNWDTPDDSGRMQNGTRNISIIWMPVWIMMLDAIEKG